VVLHAAKEVEERRRSVRTIADITAERREVAYRVALVPLFVAVCYLFEWWDLRAITVVVLLKLSALLHLPMQRTGADLVNLNGLQIQFGIACTMVDAFFGAVPLLWRLARSWQWNVARLTAVFAGVSLLNIFRLELGFVALPHGVPWWLAHECVAGVAYFCVFLFIMHESAWKESRSSEEPVEVKTSAQRVFA
jgi:hypothetical protein